MNKDALQKFVASYPDFFEQKGGYYALRPDIHGMMEEYARLVDPEEFERVQRIMDSIRKENQEQYEHQIRANQEQIKHFESQLPEITTRLNDFDDEIAKFEQQIGELKKQLVKLPQKQKPWYYSSLVFWLLALAGIICMYVGIFIAVSGASSFLPLGLTFLVLGVALQSREVSNQPRSDRKDELVQQECERLSSELHLLKVKRATCLQQKIIAKQNVDKLKTEINAQQQKKHILNG